VKKPARFIHPTSLSQYFGQLKLLLFQTRPGATIQRMIDWSTCTAVERDPGRLSGAWVFRGSRVPVAALFENLEDGVPVGEFIELFPGVTLLQARSVLEHAARSSLATV